MAKNIQTREEWLKQAIILLTDLFTEMGHKVPKKIRVSCGFPSVGAFAKKKRRIGECWSDSASRGKYFEIFISPTLGKAFETIDTLSHEMVHAVAGLKCGHRGQFKRIALEIGLTGPMRSCGAGPELKKRLNDFLKALGPYPHDEITKLTNARKKQGTRMIKIVCPDCGYTARTTRQWLETGLPTCPCGESMCVPGERDDD